MLSTQQLGTIHNFKLETPAPAVYAASAVTAGKTAGSAVSDLKWS